MSVQSDRYGMTVKRNYSNNF